MINRWDVAATIRKYQIESGLDLTFSHIFVPYFQTLVKELKPITVLEIGSGTGHMAKELILFCDYYVGVEPSKTMFDISLDVIASKKIKMVNCCIEDYVPKSTFDFVYSHLCAHVIDNIDVFLSKISVCVNDFGHWSFSIPHPCFYNDYKKIFDENYAYMDIQKTEFNLTITKHDRLIEKVPYIHRPLEFYINKINENKLILSGIDEIYPEKEVQLLYGTVWDKPRYLVFKGTLRKK
jgi:SAM-dependent methyltransferase